MHNRQCFFRRTRRESLCTVNIVDKSWKKTAYFARNVGCLFSSRKKRQNQEKGIKIKKDSEAACAGSYAGSCGYSSRDRL